MLRLLHHWRVLLRLLHHSRSILTGNMAGLGNRGSLELGVSRAVGHADLRVLVGLVCHLVLGSGVRHHHVGLRCDGLVRLLGMLTIRRSSLLGSHGLVLSLLAVVHGWLLVKL